MTRRAPEGVVVTGAYGAGKSSLIEEIATVLEASGHSFAAIDLDWLMWFQSQEADFSAVYLENLRAVVSNYLTAGVRLFVVAGTVRDSFELAKMRQALPFPLKVIRLTVPMAVIEQRLSAGVTTGRADDLRVAFDQLQNETGAGIEDLTLANEGTIQEAADRALSWLGWLGVRPA